jgi:EAL domain-containing protein (putative c-di-GMP-specific phosphodiesterase class I)
MNFFGEVANSNVSILVDEVGIEVGVFGDYRLKTSYHAIFRRLDGMLLEPFAVEASISPFLRGRPVDPEHFSAALPVGDRPMVENLGRALSLKNLHNLGADDVSLFIDVDLAALEGADGIGFDRASETDPDPSRLICVIATASLLDRHDLVEHTLTLRSAGCSIAVSGFGTGPWDIACMQAVRPDIVQLDASWFRRAVSHPAAAKLLVPLVAGLHDLGANILIEGISSAAELRAALDCGADIFQGDLFGPPVLAGAGFNPARKSAAEFLGDGAKVVPLFA